MDGSVSTVSQTDGKAGTRNVQFLASRPSQIEGIQVFRSMNRRSDWI
jgi:hypothetical protein